MEINTQFLARGGEMGKLTREHDWSSSSLGTPDKWPQSLRTTLSIILNSKFPMFLFWGKELICFYNDAYRPSLGNDGKHPSSLGKPAAEVWPEIWHFIKPIIDKVLTDGEACWNEDQLLPIYRNGQFEDVYWTFSYSPVIDETDQPAGVFVTCSETTKTLNATKDLLESRNQLQFAIDATELGTFDYDPILNKVSANQRMKDMFHLPNKPDIKLDDALSSIAEKDKQRVTEAITKTLQYDSGGRYNIQYSIVNPTTKKEIFVRAKGKTWFNEDKVAYRFNGTLQDVTEHVLARQKIEESEERFRTMAEGTDILIAVADETSHVIYMNKAWMNLTGRSLQDLLNVGWMDLMHPEDRGTYTNIYLDAFAKKLPFTGEFRLLNKDGHYNWLLAKAPPRFTSDGSFAGYISTCIDITHQKKVEQDLRESAKNEVAARKKVEESEQRARTMVYNAPFPIGVYEGREMRVALANQAILDVWGKGKNVIGTLYSELLPELGNEEIFENLDKVYTTGVPFQAKNKRLDFQRNGKMQTYYFNYNFTPLYDVNNKVYGVMSTSADVTDLNIAKQKVENVAEELAKTTNKLQLALEAGKLGSYEFDLSTGNVDCTPQCAQNFGLSSNAHLNYQELIATILPEDWRQIQGAVRNALINKLVYSTDFRVVWPDKSIHWLHAVGLPYYNEDGKAIQVIGVTTEITEQKLFAEELGKQVEERTKEIGKKNKDLEKMNAELESFAYVSSHDLQEPLRKIQTFSDRILKKEEANLSDEGKNYFYRMQQAAKRMQILIEDLLAYSRTNNTDQIFKTTDLKKIAKDVKEELRDTMQVKNASILLGDFCEAKIIPFQFRQLFHNLISNSLKFASAKRLPVIHIKSEIVTNVVLPNLKTLDKTYCHIMVSDNGIGFEPEYKDKIFEVFQRLHAREDYQGTGIGLAIVKKIIDNHNGIIIATGELDKGATFDIYIPH